ncbi:uncharacterized protein SCODWIG_03233 [Saccharomycodes ludwigii]|uniref:Mitochondrial outer membrane protein OM14 C-terminal domain-containing protein n=1 Tax=Saccharomycodes ludwigii TaxID=36035 RepID=A0A376B9Y8_9ASCO|nr:hypothetical protein SCDLUD_000999 [Saccharomycodes ludwigii]KAH3903370.1 hypothetical protein SCDLUD_000999 [Saccharomycodes ludwigii]SSD61472.1 uncharacterized protein SCODWIG_03233 [Saccharomycodes ludwigii]
MSAATPTQQQQKADKKQQEIREEELRDLHAKTHEKATKISKDTKNFAREVNEKASKKFEEGESYLKKIYSIIGKYASATSQYLSASVVDGSVLLKEKTNVLLQEFKNPVVSGHFILGVSILTAILHGYAEHHARYLKGKSDKEILLITGGSLLALVADGVLVKNLYPKYKRE